MGTVTLYVISMHIICFAQPLAAMTHGMPPTTPVPSWALSAQTWRNMCNDYQQELANCAPALLQLAQERHPTGCAFLDAGFALQPHEYATQLAPYSLEALYEGLRFADYLDLRGDFIALLTRYCATRFWQEPEQALALLARTSDHEINHRLRENMFQLDTAFMSRVPPLRLQHPWYLIGFESLAWSHDDRTVITVSEELRRFWVWDVATGICRTAKCPVPVFSVAFNHDSSLLIVALGDWTARILDAATYRQRACLRGHLGNVRAAEFNPDSTGAITASEDKTARVWCLDREGRQTTVQPRHILAGHAEWVCSAHFSPDGSLALTVSGFTSKNNSVAHLWNVETGQQVRIFAISNNKAQFNQAGTRIALDTYCHAPYTVSLYHVFTGEQLNTFHHEPGVCNAINFSNNSTQMYTSWRSELYIWDTTAAFLPPFIYRFPFRTYQAVFNKQLTHIVTNDESIVYIAPIKAPPCSLEQALVIARLLQEPENRRAAFLRAPAHAQLRAHFDALDSAWHTILTPRYKITQAVLHLWAFIIFCIRSCFLAKKITIPR